MESKIGFTTNWKNYQIKSIIIDFHMVKKIDKL